MSQGVTIFDGICAPAATAASKCVVSEAETEIVAGQPASLRITRFDRFGNRISTSEGQAPLSAEAHGPGTLSTQVVDYADGASAVYYTARCISADGRPAADSVVLQHGAICSVSQVTFTVATRPYRTLNWGWQRHLASCTEALLPDDS